jgi:hypothetical protein
MRAILFLGLSAVLAASPAQAKAKPAAAKSKPAALKWIDSPPPGLPPGATFAVVSGDPTKAGKFTIRLKFPPRYAIAPHWHPSDEKVTLKSGKLSYGMGPQFSRPNAKGLGVGETIVMKAKMNHWVFTGDGAEVEVSATGPFKINYVHPNDDPRGKQTSAR